MRFFRHLFAPFLMLTTFSSYAQGSQITINDATAQLGLEYRGELTYADNKLTEILGGDASTTTTIDMVETRLLLNGTYKDRVKFDLNYGFVDLSGTHAAVLNWGWVEFLLSEKFTVLMGREFTNEGGWDNYNWLYDTIVLNPFTSKYLALGGTQDLVEFRYHFKGTLSLQLMNDVVATSGTGEMSDSRFNTTSKQPAWTLEYTGTFGPVTPLLQYGSYDLNHSNFMVVGLKTEVSVVEAYLDYVMDNRSYRAAAGGDKEDKYTHTAITADVKFKISKKVTPWVKLAIYDVKQPNTDLKGNDPANGVDNFEDNAQIIALGATLDPWDGSGFKPYAAVINRSAKFLKGATTETESKSDLMIKLGVMGKI